MAHTLKNSIFRYIKLRESLMPKTMIGKYSIVLYPSKRNKNREGKLPIYLRITKKGALKHLSLNMHAHEEQWDKQFSRFKKDKRKNPSYEEDNRLLNTYEKKADEIMKQLSENGDGWTLDQFMNAFIKKETQGSVSEYLELHINNWKEKGHYGNSKIYSELARKLINTFPNYKKLTFNQIDIRFVNQFDHEMEKKGLTGNTRSRFHRTLKALINKAIKEKIADEKYYPYGNKGFSTGSIEQETQKRYLDDHTLTQFKEKESIQLHIEQARKIFLFCFYAHGMSFVDAARLTNENIISLNGKRYIEYKRQKTKNFKAKPIIFAISPEIESLFAWFKSNGTLIGDYLLPIVSRDSYQGQELYNHIMNRYKRVSKNLKAYCKEIGLKNSISTYWSRHTFAQRIITLGVGQVQQALGHKSLSTTQTYLAGFNVDEHSAAIQQLL